MPIPLQPIGENHLYFKLRNQKIKVYCNILFCNVFIWSFNVNITNMY